MFGYLQLRKASAEVDRDFYISCFLSSNWSFLFDLNFHDSKLDKEQYINQKISAQYPDLIRLMVYDTKTNKQIVFGNVITDDYTTKRCSLTGGVDATLMNRGYGSVGLYLFLKFIFLDMKMNKVTCHVYDFNSPSFRMLENSGFKLEGILREHAFDYTTQKLVNVKVYSMLTSEFLLSRLYNSLKKINFKEIPTP